MSDLRQKRKRRTAKQVLAHGQSAKRKHARKTGRSGSIISKQFAGLMESHLDKFPVEKQKRILGLK